MERGGCVRYVESLKEIANGNATKIFMPAELSGIASATGVIGEMFQASKVTPQVKAAPGQVAPPPEIL